MDERKLLNVCVCVCVCFENISDLKSLPLPRPVPIYQRVLLTMKAMKALDKDGDGQISEDEFFRLYNKQVIDAAQSKLMEIHSGLRCRIVKLWSTIPLNGKKEIERLACWDLILADNELLTLMGTFTHGDINHGRS